MELEIADKSAAIARAFTGLHPCADITVHRAIHMGGTVGSIIRKRLMATGHSSCPYCGRKLQPKNPSIPAQ